MTFRRISRRSGRWLPRRFAIAFAVLTAGTCGARGQETYRVTSPDSRTEVAVGTQDGALFYSVDREDRKVILPSRLGFELRDAPALAEGLEITGTQRGSLDETWEQPWGEVARVRNRYNELRITVEESAAPGRHFDVVFRAFDDGVGFRYEFPEQPGMQSFVIMDELTEYWVANDAKAWWIEANDLASRYEMLYASSPMSTLPEVHTPLTMEMQSGLYVVLHEANLVDYAGMNLTGSRDRHLKVTLTAWADGAKVYGQTPFASPWRTIQMADRAADLVPSVIGLNLNPPNALGDVSWVEPMKYVGIWWGMHINRYMWGSGPKHGATTTNTKRMIDFAAANGFGGVLVEGWNVGWDGDWIANADRFSFTQPYPDYDFEELAAYARDHGVTLIGHNETSMGVENYERQMDNAFDLYQRLGIRAIKTGYVGDKTAEGHAHHGQYMVRHYRRVIEGAAARHIMIDVHEPIKDTGERRTYPNMMTREGARGQEYNAWAGDGGNPPEHETILFFTRLLAGPMDFTPGVFDILIRSANGIPRTPEEPRVRTTLAKQLALFVVLYSPLQMASDLPENYEGQPAFQFIRDVAVDWEQTRVLEGRIGDYVVVARQERGGPDWFIGAITDEEARTFEVPLTFLDAGREYIAEIYADGPDADWLDDPLPVTISEQRVNAGSTLRLRLAPGGGQAIRIRPAS